MANKHTSITRVRQAFSLIEMMAVLVILAILLAIGVPSIRSMIYSSERSLAENQLRVAMTAARDAAVRSGGGDAAAVFFYQDNRTVIIPCVSVGIVNDRKSVAGADVTTGPQDTEREVFVPVEGVEPIRMPLGWNVRGYAAPGVIPTQATGPSPSDGWMDCTGSMPTAIANQGHWVFPETSFLNLTALSQPNGSVQGEDEGWKRQTFMVRFESGTGNAAISARVPVLVLDPLPVLSGEGFRGAGRDPYAMEEHDPTQAASLEAFVRQQINNPQLRAGNPPDITKILGDVSPDTVLAMPVTEIALYDEARMASAIGVVRLNTITNCLYGNMEDENLAPTVPEFDRSTRTWGGAVPDAQDIQARINAYMTRDAHTPRVLDESTSFEARVFTIQRYMGQLTEVSPEVES